MPVSSLSGAVMPLRVPKGGELGMLGAVQYHHGKAFLLDSVNDESMAFG